MRHLADAGTNLVLVARRSGRLEETATACRVQGAEVRPLPWASRTARGRAADHRRDGDLSEFQRVIDLNITAPMTLVQHFGRGMRERRRGGSPGRVAGRLPRVRAAQGVRRREGVQPDLPEGLWLELMEYDVHVLELVLGVTRTPARERVGINVDVPGMLVAEPEDVALEGLTNLPHGMVHVAGGNDETPRAATTRTGPRWSSGRTG